jgi:hypothetical protein
MGQEEVFVGTVFVTEEDSEGDSLVGIETERYEIFIEEGEHDERVKPLYSHGVSGCIPASGFSGSP